MNDYILEITLITLGVIFLIVWVIMTIKDYKKNKLIEQLSKDVAKLKFEVKNIKKS